MDTWLVTGATCTPITNVVAEVFKENCNRDRLKKNACIGIAPWGIVHDKASLASAPVNTFCSMKISLLITLNDSDFATQGFFTD